MTFDWSKPQCFFGITDLHRKTSDYRNNGECSERDILDVDCDIALTKDLTGLVRRRQRHETTKSKPIEKSISTTRYVQ